MFTFILFNIFAETLKEDITLFDGNKKIATLFANTEVSTYVKNGKLSIGTRIFLNTTEEVKQITSHHKLTNEKGMLIGITHAPVNIYLAGKNIYGISGTSSLKYEDIFYDLDKKEILYKGLSCENIDANCLSHYLFVYANKRFSYNKYFVAEERYHLTKDHTRFFHFIFASNRDRDLVGIVTTTDLDVNYPVSKLSGTSLNLYIFADSTNAEHQIALANYLSDFNRFASMSKL